MFLLTATIAILSSIALIGMCNIASLQVSIAKNTPPRFVDNLCIKYIVVSRFLKVAQCIVLHLVVKWRLAKCSL
jgi:hypothetical protein